MDPDQPDPARRGARLLDAVRVHAAVSLAPAAIVPAIWIAADRGYFWPAWVWFGLALPLALHAAVVRAIVGTAPGRRRGLAVHVAAASVIGLGQVVIWALSGFGYFWPFWPLLGLSTAVAVHALVVIRRVPAREQELAERVDVLTRTRRGALDVQAAELRRIERDLHDGAQARLVALSMQLGRAEERLAEDPETAELVRQARGEASAAIAELRDLARGIAPPVLVDRGLAAAVEALGRRSAIPVELDAVVDRRPPPVVETAAYFVVAEALTNVAKHAPEAEARVRLTLAEDELTVEVRDTGPGGADAAGGGITGLRRRVEALDGSLSMASPAGEGTTIRAVLPCVS